MEANSHTDRILGYLFQQKRLQYRLFVTAKKISENCIIKTTNKMLAAKITTVLARILE